MRTGGSTARARLAFPLVFATAGLLVLLAQAVSFAGEKAGPAEKPLREEDFAWVCNSSLPDGVTSACAVPQGRTWATTRDGIYSYDGKRWGRQFIERDGEGRAFTCISGRDGKCAWAVSTRGTDGGGDLQSLIYSFDGRSWRSRGAPEAAVRGIAALGTSTAWAVGTKRDGGSARGAAYIFDGRSWRERLDVSEALNSVSAADAAHVWAVGEGGGIYLFDGNRWELSQRVSAHLNQVHSLNRSRAYACGLSGRGEDARSVVFLFDGRKWCQIGSFSAGGDGMLSVVAQEPYDAWAADGESLYHFNGSFWRIQYHVPRGFQPTCIAAAQGSGLWVAGAGGGLFKRVNVSALHWLFPNERFR